MFMAVMLSRLAVTRLADTRNRASSGRKYLICVRDVAPSALARSMQDAAHNND
jgi:hypothetical protein